MEQSIQKTKSQRNLSVWMERVEACRRSGLSVEQWCAENGIVSNTYYRWQKKVFGEIRKHQDQFFEVPVSRPTSGVAASIEHNGFYASIYCGADEETIRALLGAMKSC